MSVAGTWLWFDEFQPGSKVELGSFAFNRDNIIAFAGKFDPQPFHLSEQAGAQSHFGGLCATGLHTAAVYMKCCAAYNLAGCNAAAAHGNALPPLGPSPGFENLRWHKPVYPGDEIVFHNEITGKRELSSRPHWGLVFAGNTGINQHGATVFSFDGKLLVARRAG